MAKNKNLTPSIVANTISQSNSIKEVLKLLGISKTALQYYRNKYPAVQQEYEKLKQRIEEDKQKTTEKKGVKEHIPKYYDRNVEREVTDALMMEIGRMVKAKAKYDITAIADTGLFVLERFQDTAIAFGMDIKAFVEKAGDFYIKYKDDIEKLEQLKELSRELARQLAFLYSDETKKHMVLDKLEDVMIALSMQDKEIPDKIVKMYIDTLMGL